MNRYSFRELLSKDIVIDQEEQKTIVFQKIEIPMIQRDYAQGREDESEVRNRFLKSIFSALQKNEFLDMDFVYGSVWESEDKKSNAFIPLDGQQRLTILFLLHWYIGSRELDQSKWKDLNILLRKFTYETRVSSRRFCEKLTDEKIYFDKFPSKKITNLPWCFNSYKKDPTIKSMLNMLDAIHEKYNEIHNERNLLFENLQKLQFYLLPLDGFNLTEELYVKMNARGKQLEDFENFKADLIKWMKDDESKYKDTFQDIVTLEEREMPYYLSFSVKIDTKWTNFFWAITKDYDVEKKDKTGKLVHPEGKIVDPLFMRFFNRYLCNLSVVSSEKAADKIEEEDTAFRYFCDDSEITYNSFDHYRSELNENVINNIAKVLDCISENSDSIKEHVIPSWEKFSWEKKHIAPSWESSQLFTKSINLIQRVAFFATTIFIEENKKFSEDAYGKWMRFVWNIIFEPNFGKPRMIGAIRFVEKAAKYSSDIYHYLADCPKAPTAYSKTQFEEECFKAKLISDSSEDWEKEIIEAESHSLFKGNIRFLLTDNEKTSFENFKKNKEAAFKIFNEKDLSAKNYLWVRTILAKSNDIELPVILHFDNWRALINGAFIKEIREVIKEVISSNKAIEEILSDICDNYERDPKQIWVYPLVKWVGESKETLLGNFSETRRIKKYDNNVYLFNKTRWTERNIILSNYRNKIIEKLISNNHSIVCTDRWRNIQDRFFRGWDIKLEYNYNGYLFEFLFDRQYLRVWVKDSDDIRGRISLEEDKKADGWICVKKYDYQKEVTDESEIASFIRKLNSFILDFYRKFGN